MARGKDSLALLALLAIVAISLRARPSPSPAPGRRLMTFNEIRAFAVLAGFTGAAADIAAAIALAESGGDSFAQGDPHGSSAATPNGTSTSFGLWQVHTPVHQQYKPSRLLQEPLYSAQAAYAISNGGVNFNPWTTFRDGTYKRFLPTGGAA
jgi:hypothetical protein